MASKFNPAGKSTKRPAVCRKGLFPLPMVYVAGLPTSLTVFCSSDETSGYNQISESFRLFWDPVLARWRGASAENGPNIQVIVDQEPGEDMYDITINIRQDDAILEQYTWADQRIPAGPPFDSGLLNRPAGVGIPGLNLHAIN